MVLATGVSVRMLDVPGVEPLLGVGVYYGAAMTEAATYRGQDVCIVGGANSAGQGALFFSRYARRVTMLVRGDRSGKVDVAVSDRPDRGDAEHRGRHASVEVDRGPRHGPAREGRRRARLPERGANATLDAAAMFIFIGARPRTEMVAGLLELDEQGYVLTGPDLSRSGRRPRGWTLDRDPSPFETSVPGSLRRRRRACRFQQARGGRRRRGLGRRSHSVHRYLETV